MPHTSLIIHFVWATWDRIDMIDETWERPLYAQICHEATRLEASVLALGGTGNHLHLLVGLKPIIAPAVFIGEIKGSSSFVVNQQKWFGGHFQWQGDYSAFSVSRWDKPKIIAYVNSQKEHHANGTIKSQLELPPSKR
ncbi:transposase [bacterium]|nr:MAG: transposase [bacterium]